MHCYTFLVNRFGIFITHHHVPLYMMREHKWNLFYHKFWSFQSRLGIMHIIFLGKHTFHISCPKDWAVSHFLANDYMKVSEYLHWGKIKKSFYLLHRDTNKMIDTGRFGNLDFVESAVTVSKSVQKKKVVKWFSKYFLTLFFKMCMKIKFKKIFTCQRIES